MNNYTCPKCNQETTIKLTTYTNAELRKFIGGKIKEYREKRRLTQTELAKIVGKSSPAYIAFIESGMRNIDSSQLYKIVFCLGEPINSYFPYNM